MADETAAEPAATDEETDHPVEPEVERRHGVPLSRSRGQVVLHPSRDQYVAVVQALRDEGFWTCVDLCAVDQLDNGGRDLPPVIAPERFEVVVGLLNHAARERVRLRVQVPEEDATLPSLTSIHPGVEAPEREAFDLFGIHFDGHPDLTRILLPDEWVGHPLRKDHAVGRIPVQFKAAPAAR